MRKILKHTIGIAIGILLLVSVVRAATYNFYFNNTEQGANSTAAPSLTVNSDGKPASAVALPVPVGTAVPAPQPPDSKSAPQVKAAEEKSVADASQENEAKMRFLKQFRFTLGAGFAQVKSRSPYEVSGNPYGESTVKAEGGLGSIGFFFTDWLGVNFFVGVGANSGGGRMNVFGGGELEIVPIRISLFNVKDFLMLSGLIGGSSVYDLSNSNGAGLEPHAGGRFTLQLSDHWGLTAAARFILNKGYFESNSNYVTSRETFIGEAGLTVRL